MTDPTDIIRRGSLILGVPLTEEAQDLLASYIGLLLTWNRRINLTSLRKPSAIAISHVLDSLTVFKVISRAYSLHFLDVGTGAGLPGMVMKIAAPSLSAALLDRDPKKIVFLKHVARELGIEGIRFLNVNVLEMIAQRPEELFDVVVSRAFSSEPAFLNGLAKLLKPGGSLVRMAGPASLRTELSLKNFVQADSWEGTLPFSDRFRRVERYTILSEA